MTDPATLITHGARWQAGAWTPARCALWRRLGPKGRKWLEQAVMDETKLGLDEKGKPMTHQTQLPPGYEALLARSGGALAGETACGATHDAPDAKQGSREPETGK